MINTTLGKSKLWSSFDVTNANCHSIVDSSVKFSSQTYGNNSQHVNISEHPKLQWVRNKCEEFEQLNKFKLQSPHCSPNGKIRSSFSYNKKCSQSSPKQSSFTSKKTPQISLKPIRINSEPDALNYRARSLPYNKYFNKTLIDREHNFIGRGYLKQIIKDNQLKQRKANFSLPSKYSDLEIQQELKGSSVSKDMTFNGKSHNMEEPESHRESSIRGFDQVCTSQLEDYNLEEIRVKISGQLKKNVGKEIKKQIKEYKKIKMNRFRLNKQKQSSVGVNFSPRNLSKQIKDSPNKRKSKAYTESSVLSRNTRKSTLNSEQMPNRSDSRSKVSQKSEKERMSFSKKTCQPMKLKRLSTIERIQQKLAEQSYSPRKHSITCQVPRISPIQHRFPPLDQLRPWDFDSNSNDA